MITKTLQARHLHVGYEIVDGGDGKPRAKRRIQEVTINSVFVEAVVRVGDVFEHRRFQPKDEVRIVRPS